MRNPIWIGLIMAATGAAQDLPRFELDVSNWRHAMARGGAPGQWIISSSRQSVVAMPPAKCAIRLREVAPLAQGKMPLVRPDERKRFAVSEAPLPAPACAQRQ